MASNFFLKYSEWIFRAVVVAGILAGLYLNTKYVTRDEFDARMGHVEAAVIEINTTLKLMQEQNKVNDRQDETLKDFEKRLRTLEHGGK